MVRVKRRYIVLSIDNTKKTQDNFIDDVRNGIAQSYGDYGVACFNRGFSLKKYDLKNKYAILAVRRGVHDMVMSILPLMKDVEVHIIHLSGTIRGCLKHMKTHFLAKTRRDIAQRMKSKKAQIITVPD